MVWSWHALDHVIQDRDPDLPNYAKPYDRPERIDINGDRDPDPPSEEEQQAEQDEMEAMGYAGGEDEEPADESEADEEEEEEEEEEEDPEDVARKARVKNADWMHTNGIDYNAALDQIVISARRFDEVWIIDHATTTEEAAGPRGDLLYRWGNPFAYGMGEWEKRQLYGQHHVQWIPEGQLGAGNLILFNNGARPREWSSADEWWAPRDSEGNYPREEGQPWGPAELEWSYEAKEPEDFSSGFISGVHRLPNGNTLICCGAPGWGPRTLDLDIILFGDLQMDSKTLQIPHYGVAEREFVLIPLQELQADLIILGKGAVKDLIAQLPTYELSRINNHNEQA